MKRFVSKLTQFPKKLIYFVPSKLPTGMGEFDQFYGSIIKVYDFPDLPSYKRAVGTMIMHLGPTTIRKPKRFFALGIMKSQANQVAYENIQISNKETEATTMESHDIQST